MRARGFSHFFQILPFAAELYVRLLDCIADEG
jgi:hypothetical protein